MGKKGRREKFSPCSFESEIYMEEYETEPNAVPKNDHQKDLSAKQGFNAKDKDDCAGPYDP